MDDNHAYITRQIRLRLPFGITSAPDEFHMRLTSSLEGLDGIICIADDILVYHGGRQQLRGRPGRP